MTALLCLVLLGAPALADEPLAVPAPTESPAASEAAPAPSRLTWGEKMQGTPSFGIFWSMGLGVGSSHEFAKKYSLSGLGGDFRYHVLPSLSVGVGVSYVVLHDKVTGTVERENVALTSTQIRYADLVPVLAQAHYYLDLARPLSLFFGAGIGAVYSKRIVELTTFSISDTGWQLGLSPQVGAIVHTGAPDLMVQVKLHYATAGSPEDELWFAFEVGALAF